MIQRLLLASFLTAVLTGITVLLFELKEVDDQVVSLALEEAHGLMEHIGFFSVKDKEESVRLIEQVKHHILAEHVIRGHFVVIEMYDRARKKVLEVSDPEFEHIEKHIDRQKHDFMLTEQVVHKKFFVGGTLYVQIFTPLKVATDETAAYFEGIYRVDPKTIGNLKYRLLWTVLQVILIVFITTGALYPVIIALNRDAIKLSDDLTEANIGMLEVLGRAVSKRDQDTNLHIFRVTLYAIRLAEAVGMKKERISGLIKGAFLHDVGKIGITDAILLKPSGLDDEETRVMATHVQHGIDIIARYAWLTDALDVVRYHHEKFDGTGYPSGLAGKSIPVAARVFAIVDVFDALTAKRPYKEPSSLAIAQHMMLEDRGKKFDPDVLDVFLRIAPDLYQDIFAMDEQYLEKTLDTMLNKYFITGDSRIRTAVK